MEYCLSAINITDNISKEKNKALQEMFKSNKNFFFLIEDGVVVKDKKVFDIFINTSKKTGIEALCWAGANNCKKLPFDDDPYIEYYNDFPTSFNMFTRNVVEKVGFINENFPPNTWEELDYIKRIGDAGLSTVFGTFASPRGIDGMLEKTKSKDEYQNLTKMGEALKYWESISFEDFPINEIPTIRDRGILPTKPAIQMI